MVVDTSALVSILFLEPEAELYTKMIADARPRLISAVSFVEAAIVVEGRHGLLAGTDLDMFVADTSIDIEPVTLEQARVARQAYRTYGKGHHPAALNFGDCFAYALAKCMALPLLYKGGDFARTDVASAL